MKSSTKRKPDCVTLLPTEQRCVQPDQSARCPPGTRLWRRPGNPEATGSRLPQPPDFREDLAQSHNNRGLLLRDLGRLQEAETDFDAALVVFRQLAADFPKQTDASNDLAGACVNLAMLLAQQKQWAKAKQLLLEGRPHHLAALKTSSPKAKYRESYHVHLNLLTWVHAGLLEPADAVAAAQARSDAGWNPPADAYDAATFLGGCIAIVKRLDQLDEAQRQEAVRFYGDAAMQMLRAAVTKGFKDAARMKKDMDLASLHQREDFQKLLAELAGSGK